jgi:DNA gyrase/topoisomerase IV subunit B
MSHGIKKLNDYSHIRLRVPVYLGSPEPHTQDVIVYNDKMEPVVSEVKWTPALFTCFRELIDNALDEIVGHGYGNRVDIDFDPTTLVFSVRDNGRGIPIEWDEEHKMHLASLVLSSPRAGRNFDSRDNVAGVNGIGSSAVSITSEWFKFEIHRDNKVFRQTFKEDLFGEGLIMSDPKITDLKSDKTGTFVSFSPSKEVYKSRFIPLEFVRSRVIDVAIANPTLKIYFNGEQIKVKPKLEQTLFAGKKTIQISIEEPDFSSKFVIVPNYIKSGDFQHTIVNSIPAFSGGSHMDTFRRSFYSGLISALEKESKKRKLTPNRSDVQEGLLVYNITKMKAPDFDSQSKTRLINEDASKYIKKALDDENFFKDFIKKNKEWIEEIFKRCAERTMKKDAGDIAKAAKKALRTKIPELMDATGSDRTKCILFLMEGQSACGGIASVRNPDIHGALPLRGKVLNVNGENPKKAVENKVLSNIMSAIGLVPGQKVVRSNLRYGHLYIATDADHDGGAICSLLVNFFHTYWPELFSEFDPFIRIFQTPFIIAEKGKTRKYWYSHDYHLFDPSLYSGWTITRAKGLGTLEKVDWDHSIKNPIAFPLVDDGKMQESLDLIFNGNRADDRKKWISVN